MIKKIITSLMLGAAFSLIIPMLGNGMGNVSIANAYAKVDIDESSVWYNKEKEVFGAAVRINGGEYHSRMYKRVSVSGGWDIYRRFSNNDDWKYVGTCTGGASGYHFLDSDEVDVFIPIANRAAQSIGYQKMF